MRFRDKGVHTGVDFGMTTGIRMNELGENDAGGHLDA
jgi:hypothetical protein